VLRFDDPASITIKHILEEKLPAFYGKVLTR
jgi:hypothetical protein